MPLLMPYDLGLLEPNTRQYMDQLLASIQTWAAQVDGVNAAERLNALSSGIAGLSTVQPGTILPFGGPEASIPTGYLFCDGAAVSRDTYAALFAAVGTTWGAGNGTTTFNVPDGRGRSLYGKATSGTGSTLGGTFGAIDHTHAAGTLAGPAHAHSISGTTSSDGAHDHDVTGNTGAVDSHNTTLVDIGTTTEVLSETFSDTHDHHLNVSTSSDGAHSHSAGSLAAASGGGGAVTGASGAANPPAFVGNWMIKT